MKKYCGAEVGTLPKGDKCLICDIVAECMSKEDPTREQFCCPLTLGVQIYRLKKWSKETRVARRFSVKTDWRKCPMCNQELMFMMDEGGPTQYSCKCGYRSIPLGELVREQNKKLRKFFPAVSSKEKKGSA